MVHSFNALGRYERTIKIKKMVEDFQKTSDNRFFVRERIPQRTGLSGSFYSLDFHYLERFPIEYPYGTEIPGSGDVGGDLRYHRNKIYLIPPDKYEIREYLLDGTLNRKIIRDYYFDSPSVKREKNGFIITARTKLGPCFFYKEKYIINQILNIETKDEKSVELVFVIDFFDQDGKFLGSYRLPKWTRLLAIDREQKFYYLSYDPFPKLTRSVLVEK